MGSVINSNKNNKNYEYIYYISITFKLFDNFNRFINNSIIQNMSDLNDIGDIMYFGNLTCLTDLFDIEIIQKYRVLYKSDNFYYSRFAICKADEMEKDSKNNLIFFEKNSVYDFYFVRDFKNYLESNLKTILEEIKDGNFIINNSDSTRWNVINEFVFVSEDDRKNLINNMKDLTDLEKTYKLNNDKLNSDSYSNNDNSSNRYIKRIENYNPNNISEISKIDYFIIKKILLDVLNRNGFNNLKDLFGDCKCLVDVLGKIDNFYKEEIDYCNREILDVKEHYDKKFEEYKKEQNENISGFESVREKIKNVKYCLENYNMEEKNIKWVKRINHERVKNNFNQMCLKSLCEKLSNIN